MNENAIKINRVSLGISGLAFLAILFFATRLPFTANSTSVISYLVLFSTCITSLYRAFRDNENPIEAIRYSFNKALSLISKRK